MVMMGLLLKKKGRYCCRKAWKMRSPKGNAWWLQLLQK